MLGKLSGRSLLVIGSVLLIATAAVAGNGVGGVFQLGKINTVGQTTQLKGAVGGRQLWVQSTSNNTGAVGVFAQTPRGTGVWGRADGIGVRGEATRTSGGNYGVYATTKSVDGYAGFFRNMGLGGPTEGTGIRALGAGATGNEIPNSAAGGEFVGFNGVIAVAAGVGGSGLWALQGDGDLAITAQGNVDIIGDLSKSSGSFKIDHPLDPANQYLSHSFVESPDMMNIYNGNVVTDTNGEAAVDLPDYFEALNRDPRYQLTVIGSFAAAQISREVSDNSFAIMTSEPNVKVSWQITGIRQDAYAAAHPIIVEEEKAIAERGRYLHPVEHGMAASLSIGGLEHMARAEPN